MPRAVLVTGGVSRLGKAIADRLAGDGWLVIRSSSRPEAGADFVADLSVPGSAEALFNSADSMARERGAGRLYAVVNNAALYRDADPDKVRAVNYDAPVILSQSLLESVRLLGDRLSGDFAAVAKETRRLAASSDVEGGSIVNVLDAAVLPRRDGTRGPADDGSAYADSKRRLAAFTLDSARIFAPLAVRVNAVAPGPVLAPSGVHEKAAPVPLGRPSPDDVAHAVSFLLAAQATTGCIIPVTGAFDMI